MAYTLVNTHTAGNSIFMVVTAFLNSWADTKKVNVNEI